MIITAEQSADRIRLIAIEMKGAFGNEGALPLFCSKDGQDDMTVSRDGPATGFCSCLLMAAALVVAGLCFFGIWIPNEPSRTKYPIRGIDVSHHQRDMNWNRIRAAGIRFAYIKATEGADFTDAKFSENWKDSGAAGIVHGAYHFFTLGTSGQSQAANFIARVPVEENALAPAIDLEFSGFNRNSRLSSDEFQRELSIFWDAVVEHYGKVPVVYTANDFQKQYLSAMPIERLWIREVITTPPPGWTFWQFSPRARVPGVSGFVDLNVFHGGDREFEKLSRGKGQ